MIIDIVGKVTYVTSGSPLSIKFSETVCEGFACAALWAAQPFADSKTPFTIS